MGFSQRQFLPPDDVCKTRGSTFYGEWENDCRGKITKNHDMNVDEFGGGMDWSGGMYNLC